MKLHLEFEQAEVQQMLMLINAGGMLAGMSQQLLQNITQQIQAQQQQPRPNGADDANTRNQQLPQ